MKVKKRVIKTYVECKYTSPTYVFLDTSFTSNIPVLHKSSWTLLLPQIIAWLNVNVFAFCAPICRLWVFCLNDILMYPIIVTEAGIETFIT